MPFSNKKFQGPPAGDREQDVAAQPGDGVWADAAPAGPDGQQAEGPARVEHGGRDDAGRHPVQLPAGATEVSVW